MTIGLSKAIDVVGMNFPMFQSSLHVEKGQAHGEQMLILGSLNSMLKWMRIFVLNPPGGGYMLQVKNSRTSGTLMVAIGAGRSVLPGSFRFGFHSLRMVIPEELLQVVEGLVIFISKI